MKKQLLTIAIATLTSWAIAQPLEIIASAPPGGPTDLIARVTANYLESKLDRTNVIVLNKPGADGRLGGKYASDRAPDGTSLVVVGTGTFIFSKVLMTQLDYDYSNFDIVAPILRSPAAVIVSSKLGKSISNFNEFAAYARSTPINCGIANASSSFVAKNLLSKLAIPTIQLVPYKGSAQLMTDLIGGHIECAVDVVATYKATHASGDVKIIATAGTTSETGILAATVLSTIYPKFVFYNWFGIGILKATPDEIKKPIVDALMTMHADKQFIKTTMSLDFEVTPPPANPNEYIDLEYRRFEEIRTTLGIEKTANGR